MNSTSGAVLLKVAAGGFRMGSPKTEEGHRYWEQQREVNLPHDFFLGRTPVTQQQYQAVTGETPSDFPEAGSDAPVDSVNWKAATQFCQKLTAMDREAGVVPTNWEYRLPTEAEWEYACRAGSTEATYGALESIAWYHENTELAPQPTGQKEPNAWGFQDMLGNVWEMCQDWFHKAAQRRAARGGSYFNTRLQCRAAAREGYGGGRYCGLRLLAAPVAECKFNPAADELEPYGTVGPTIYDAINANDVRLAEKILGENPDALESLDEIPPPLHWCIYNEKPEMLKWLLDQDADLERPEQDHGAPPLNCAIVMRQLEIVRILIDRGANTERAMQVAEDGYDGDFEIFGLDRSGYRDVIELLRQLGI